MSNDADTEVTETTDRVGVVDAQEVQAEAETPEAETEAPEDDAQEDGDEPERTRNRSAERRISRLTREKREAERDALYWREMATRASSAKPSQEPEPEQGVDDLTPAAIAQRVRAEIEREASSKDMARKRDEFFERVSSADPDASEYIQDPSSPISVPMAEYLIDAEAGAQVAGWLARNEDQALKISRMPPARQFSELAKLEARLSVSKPVAKRATSAPPPPKTVGAKSASPADPAKMSDKEWVEWRNRQVYGR